MEVSLSNEYPSRNFRYDLAKAEFVVLFEQEFSSDGFEEFIEAMKHSLLSKPFTKISIFETYMPHEANRRFIELIAYIEDILSSSSFPISYIVECTYNIEHECVKDEDGLKPNVVFIPYSDYKK
jgi:hypothetical protein